MMSESESKRKGAAARKEGRIKSPKSQIESSLRRWKPSVRNTEEDKEPKRILGQMRKLREQKGMRRYFAALQVRFAGQYIYIRTRYQ
jgi:hypothetical protein